ncbi:MAG: NADH-quinone oxidoreductase subunit J [Rickettsia endosymbiont of Platyusa sonomae]|nr:NADH-quinone oxidoreductase subunit J [Rickettsia endosymbiont of Platyusa sonomae]
MEMFFYLFAGLMVISSVLVVMSKNPVYSVLWLIFTFCNGSGLMILLGAEFLAMMLVVIYVGAVAVLFLFVIMMLNIRFMDIIVQFKKNLLISMAVALIMFADLVLIICLGVQGIVLDNMGSSEIANHTRVNSGEFGARSDGVTPISNRRVMSDNVLNFSSIDSNTHAIGQVLYTEYILPFQISGIILFMAMISCITLTIRHRSGVKRQNIAKQHAKNKDNCILMVKPRLSEGVEEIQYD